MKLFNLSLRRIKSAWNNGSVVAYVRLHSEIEKQASLILFMFGFCLLVKGLESISLAQAITGPPGPGQTQTTGGLLSNGQFNAGEIKAATCKLLDMTQGAFGALIMTVAGIGAVVSSAFGGYRAGVSLLVTGCGAFILRSLVSLFFGDLACTTGTVPSP